jgi:UDP-glucose 4-epimerase
MLQGHSNLQIQMLVEKITNKEIVTFINRRREGDPPSLVADSTMFKRLADWNPVYDMSDILTSLNTWYKSQTYDALTKQRSYSNIHPAL